MTSEMTTRADDELLISAERVAAMLGVSVWLVNEYRRAGELPGVPMNLRGKSGQRPGRACFRYLKSDVLAFIAARRRVEDPAAEGPPARPAPAKSSLPDACGGVDPLWGGAKRRR